MYIVMLHGAKTLRKARNKQKEYYDRRAKENTFKVVIKCYIKIIIELN